MPSNFHHPALRHAQTATAFAQRLWVGLDRYTQLHFLFAVILAFFLHLTAYGIWLLIPKTQIVDVPVRVLNIKLGDVDDSASADIPQPNSNNSSDVENIISSVARDASAPRSDAAVKSMEKLIVPPTPKPQNMEKLMAKSKPFDMRSEGVAVAAPVMSVVEKQFVRETEPAPAAAGNPLGNSTSDKATVTARYEQLVSAWIDKFKPDKIMGGAQPQSVTSKVRIRIDRRGNIRYMVLEQGTNYIELDRAAIDTVRRANPVPAVPADYPAGETIEFIVPIVFSK